MSPPARSGDPRGGRPALPRADRPRRIDLAPARATPCPPATCSTSAAGRRGRTCPSWCAAFAAAGLDDVSLVLAGGRREQRSASRNWPASLGLGDRLRLLGWVEDADLPALYAEALAFAYPSEYEGFGLQLVESMAVGCPTLAARATCLPEVLGTAARPSPSTTSPNSPDCFAASPPTTPTATTSRPAPAPARRPSPGGGRPRGPSPSIATSSVVLRPHRPFLEIARRPPRNRIASKSPRQFISGGRCPVRSSVGPYLLVSTEIPRPR